MRRRHTRTVKRASRHPFAVPVFTFLALLVLAVTGYIVLNHHEKPSLDTRVVIITHDHVQQTVPSVEPTVGALLNKLHITLNQGDVVEPDAATPINQDDFRINVYRAVPVEVVDGSHKTYTFSAATTPRSIAAQTGTNLYPEDDVSTDPTTNFITQGSIGEQVVINRATPVRVNLYGTPLTIRTHAKTVGELVKDRGITLAKHDQLLPKATTPIKANEEIFISRKGTKLQTVKQTIAMPVETIQDNSLAYGTTAVRQQGSPGQKAVTYQISLKNGHEVGRKVIQTVVIRPAVKEIKVVGVNLGGIKGDMALAGIPAADYSYADYIISHESGWNPEAENPSGAYGLCQALPGSKMASAGSDWATDPVTQLKWCNGYADSEYGGWYPAYEHWLAYRSW